MNIAICDNEIFFLRQMEEVVKSNQLIDSIESFSDMNVFFEKLDSGKKYDIVFMDIEWNNDSKNGINYASQINRKQSDIQIIFITAFNDIYSENIFFEEINLCGYLKKPINPQYLNILLVKAKTILDSRENDILTIKNNGQIEKINIGKIMFLESKGHKVTITKTDGVSYIYDKLDVLQQKLGRRFLRIHKSYLVNMDYISQLEGRTVSLNSDRVLPISKSSSKEAKTTYLRYLRDKIREIDK